MKATAYMAYDTMSSRIAKEIVLVVSGCRATTFREVISARDLPAIVRSYTVSFK